MIPTLRSPGEARIWQALRVRGTATVLQLVRDAGVSKTLVQRSVQRWADRQVIAARRERRALVYWVRVEAQQRHDE
jgi:predicted ATPase